MISSGSTLSGRDSKRFNFGLKHRDLLLVAGCTLLALLLRSLRLNFQPLWWDEGYSVWFAHQRLGELLRLTALDIHPPLYYLVLRDWSHLFGLSPLALRWLSVLIGVSAVPVMFLAGYWLAGRRVGLVAAFLLAINPFHIYYSQEVRMYGLVTLWSALALALAGRWLTLMPRRRGPVEAPPWYLLAGYGVVLVLGLYTQYYFAFLAVGLAVAGLVALARRRAGRARLQSWLLAHMAAALLYLPWVLYAGPKLAPYVAQKTVQDSDKPLGLLMYLARHLAAYTVGHLEGPLGWLWPLGLLGLLAAAVGTLRLTQRGGHKLRRWLLLAFLTLSLTITLALGWLVNRSYPFFPEHGERLMLLGLPLFVLLTSAIWVAPDPLQSRDQRLIPPMDDARPPGFLLAGAGLLALLSLSTFYLTPRYQNEDYRPLIGQVTQWGQADDTVFAIYPWQVGYFWSYGRADGPRPQLTPSDQWDSAVTEALDRASARGRVWFPMHLALGGVLETSVESYLAASRFQVANRWYSASTRLTGWAAEDGAPADNPVKINALFSDSVRTRITWQPQTLHAANEVLPVRFEFSGPATAHVVSLRLVGPNGGLWSQQDVSLVQPGSLNLGLLIPAGTPPGPYSVRVTLAPATDARPLAVIEPLPAGLDTDLVLGEVQVLAPSTPLPVDALPIEQPFRAAMGDAATLLGYSATPGPLLPGEDVTVTVFWQALAGAATRDLSAFVQLLDGQGQVAAGWEGPPVDWHLTSAWQPGELVRSQHTLRLPATLEPGRYRLVLGLFDPQTGDRLTAARRVGPFDLFTRRGQLVQVGRVEIGERAHEYTAPRPQKTVNAAMQRLGGLVGYDLAATRVEPGAPLALTLYWQPRETTNQRLTVFVHLVDAQGEIIGQSDNEPDRGAHPTTSWLPEEYITDAHTLTVAGNTPPGPAALLVGLYDPLTGERVLWVGADGAVMGDTLRLPAGVAVETQVQAP